MEKDTRAIGQRAAAVWLAACSCLVLVAGLAFQEPEPTEDVEPIPMGASTPTPEPTGFMPDEPTPEPTAFIPDEPTIQPAPPPTATADTSDRPTPELVDRPTLTPPPMTSTPVRPVITTPGTRTPTPVVLGDAPPPPARVIVRAIAAGTVGIEWDDSSDNEQGFRIDVSGPSTFPRSSRTLPANTAEYNIGGLPNGTYCFAVVAFNQSGESPPVSVCIGVR